MVDTHSVGLGMLGHSYSEGYQGFYEGLCYGEEARAYFDMSGNKVIDATAYDFKNYTTPGNFHCGRAAVSQDGKYGYIDTTGEIAVPIIYDAVEDFTSTGLAVVRLGQKKGIIDTFGRIVVPIEYEWAHPAWPNNLFIQVSLANGQTDVFKPDGTLILSISGESSHLSIEKDIIIHTRADGMYSSYDQCYNSSGLILPSIYRSIKWFDDNKVIIIDKKFERGVLRHDGSVIVPLGKYDNISPVSEGLSIVEKGGQHGCIDSEGNVMIPLQDMGYSPSVNGYIQVWGKRGAGFIHNPLMLDRTQSTSLAYARTQSVQVDGKSVEFQMYALMDTKGNETNYVKLRDVASALNASAAQFNVGWNGNVNIEIGKTYVPNGSEMRTPFSGDRSYQSVTAPTNVNGAAASLDAFVLTDDKGSGYTYYKLRDLGTALGFKVDWSAEKGIFIESK